VIRMVMDCPESELRGALDVEDDDTVCADIRELLQLLRDRSDVVYLVVLWQLSAYLPGGPGVRVGRPARARADTV